MYNPPIETLLVKSSANMYSDAQKKGTQTTDCVSFACSIGGGFGQLSTGCAFPTDSSAICILLSQLGLCLAFLVSWLYHC